MYASSKKEVAKSVKTLLILLQSMRNQEITITLRNDYIVQGTLLKIDDNMNIELENATVEPDPFYNTSSFIDDNRQSSDEDEIVTDEPRMLDDDDDDSSNTKTRNRIQNDTTILPNQQADKQNHNDEDDGAGDYERAEDDEADIVITARRDHKYLLVKGSRVRHVDVPADCDLLGGAKRELDRVRNKYKQWTKRDIIRPS